MDEALITPKQVAKILQMSERWVRLQAARGSLPCVQCGKMVRFRREDLRAYIERNHRAGAEAA